MTAESSIKISPRPRSRRAGSCSCGQPRSTASSEWWPILVAVLLAYGDSPSTSRLCAGDPSPTPTHHSSTQSAPRFSCPPLQWTERRLAPSGRPSTPPAGVIPGDCPSHWLPSSRIDPNSSLAAPSPAWCAALLAAHQFIRVSNDQVYLLPSRRVQAVFVLSFVISSPRQLGGG